jgi:hypothetical protein
MVPNAVSHGKDVTVSVNRHLRLYELNELATPHHKLDGAIAVESWLATQQGLAAAGRLS